MSFVEELKRRNVFRVGIAYSVAAWLLIQVSDIVFPRIGLPDSAVTLVIALLVIGFIPALILAWAFEMTPEGIKLETEVDRQGSITPETGKRLDRLIIAGLVLVILGMGIERVWFAGPGSGSISSDAKSMTETTGPGSGSISSDAKSMTETTDPEKLNLTPVLRQSVAVLPFDAMSSGEDDGYFADGLTEEILNSLAGLPELLVTARTSSFHFKGKNLPIPEIAKILGVANVVEGSVRRSGERVRITAQLIRAEDGFHLWSDTYDRTLEDVFAVQEDIAESIAQTLDVVLNDDKREAMRHAGIGNVEAFIAYQKGLEIMEQAHSISEPIDLLPEANRYFDQALALVPTITDAQIERTDLYGHMIYDFANGTRSFTQEELDTAMTELQSGLSQAARHARSDAQRAYIEAERAEFSDDWSGIPSRLDRAFETPECFRANWVTSLAGVFGWAEQTFAHYQQMTRCDPLSSLYATMAGQFGLWAGQTDEVIELTGNFLSTVGFNAWVDDIRFFALLASADYRDEPDMYGPNHAGSYYKVPRKIFTYAMDNEITKARALFDASRQETVVDDMALLLVEAALGNREAANAYASKLDARFAGPFILAEAVKGCFCGAPFDLEATPNFRTRIEEAGFSWPPVSPIKYPAKDW